MAFGRFSESTLWLECSVNVVMLLQQVFVQNF